jgi:GAF domain
MTRHWAFVIELLFLYLVIDAINLFFFPTDLGFSDLILSPYWIPVLILSSRYGISAGLISGLISAAHLLYFEFGHLPSRFQLEVQAETASLLLPSAFVLVGVLLGGVRQKSILDQQRLAEELARVQARRDAAERRFLASEEARTAIEARVVGETATVQTLYDIAVHFETLKEGEIFQGFIDAVEAHFEVKRCAIFLREEVDFVVKAACGWSERELAEGKLRASETALSLAFESGKVISARQLSNLNEPALPDASSYLALFPLGNNGKPYGVVAIEEMSFLTLTQSNLELIGLIVDWMARALKNRDQLARLQGMAIWDEKVNLYSVGQFRDSLIREFARARLFDQELSVSILQVINYSHLQPSECDFVSQTIAALLIRMLGQPMICSVYDLEGVFAVIAPSTPLILLTAKLASLRGEFQKILHDKGEERGVGLAEGGVQLNDTIRTPWELERAALRAAGIDYALVAGEAILR